VTACAAFAAAYAHPDSEAARDGAVAVGCLAVAGALAWRARGTWAAPVVLALVLAPSLCAEDETSPTTDGAAIEAPAAWASTALAERADSIGEPLRVFRPYPFKLSANASELGLADSAATLAGESAATWGLAHANTRDPARDVLADRIWQSPTQDALAVLVDRFGVRIAIVPTSVISPRSLPAIGVTEGGNSLASMPTAPLASVMHGWRWSGSTEDAMGFLFAPGGGLAIPRGTVVLRGSGESSNVGAPPVPCEIDSWRDGAITTRCDSGTEPGYAVITSSAARGWSVRVDGEPRDWLTADLVRRAVALPPGRHLVVWSYLPPGLPAGAALTALGLVALAGLGWAARRGKVAPT
jgi:hypothetical protein